MKFKKSLITIALGALLSTVSFAGSQHSVSDHKNTANKQQKLTASQVKQIEGVIHNYLINNPQVLLEASRALQAQQQKQMEHSAIAAVKANAMGLFNDPNSPSVGNKNAQTVLVEFFDYQCGHCRQMAKTVEKVVSNDQDVRVIFKELPIFGGMSKFAAEAALAAAKQGKYYQFHNMLFDVQGPLTKTKVMDLAKKAGLNVTQLKSDMKSTAVSAQIKANFQLAKALRVMGTPTFVVSNKQQTKFRYIPGATSLNNLEANIKSVR